MIPVRQSTAFETSIGPVLDADGVAFEGAVVGDFQIKKNGGDWAALNGSATATHTSVGDYDLVLTASDLDTVGVAAIRINDTVNACATLYLQVIEEAVYDALYAASAVGPLLANDDGSGLTEAGGTGDQLTAINLPNQTMDIVGNITGNLSGSVGSVTGNVGGSVASVTAGVTLANGAITDASLAGNMEIVFETDFATNYNTTRNAWATNVQDLVGTTALVLASGGLANVTAWTVDITGDISGSVGSVTGSVTLADGAHGGTAAVLTLERIVVASTTSNEPAVKLNGSGTGAGLSAEGGATGPGILGCGGATSGAGAMFRAAGGIVLYDPGEGDGLALVGSAGKSGLYSLSTLFTTFTVTNNGIAWNANWDAEVQSEATDALNAYDPPTNAEMEARTLPAADYFDPAADTVASVTTVGSVTTKTGYELTSGERDSIAAALLDLANGIESGKTLRQAMRLMAAALAGKRSNSGTATEQFDAIGSPGTARIVGNADAAGDGTPTLTP